MYNETQSVHSFIEIEIERNDVVSHWLPTT